MAIGQVIAARHLAHEGLHKGRAQRAVHAQQKAAHDDHHRFARACKHLHRQRQIDKGDKVRLVRGQVHIFEFGKARQQQVDDKAHHHDKRNGRRPVRLKRHLAHAGGAGLHVEYFVEDGCDGRHNTSQQRGALRQNQVTDARFKRAHNDILQGLFL